MSITEDERKILIEHRINKSYITYEDALCAIKAERYSNAANRLYYSLFHACGALLLSKRIEVNRHSGMRAMIGLHFVKPGILTNNDSSLIYDVFTLRQQCDYDDFVDISKKKVEIFVEPVKDLIDRIASLLKNSIV